MKQILQAIKALLRKAYDSMPRKLSELENDIYGTEKPIAVDSLDQDGIRKIATDAANEDGPVFKVTEMGNIYSGNRNGRYNINNFINVITAVNRRKLVVLYLNGYAGRAFYYYKNEKIKESDSEAGTPVVYGYFFHNFETDSEGVKYHEIVLGDDGLFTWTTTLLAAA